MQENKSGCFFAEQWDNGVLWSSKLLPVDSCLQFPIRGLKSQRYTVLPPPQSRMQPYGVLVNYGVKFGLKNRQESLCYSTVKAAWFSVHGFHSIPACDGQTDGRTDRQTDGVAVAETHCALAVLCLWWCSLNVVESWSSLSCHHCCVHVEY